MVLEIDEIKSIILNNPNKDFINKAKAYNKRLRTQLYGENLESEITRIDGLERDALKDLRVKYTKSNKDLMARLLRPMDKISSARGGSRYFHLSDSLEKKAAAIASNVKDGLSIKKWIETYWAPHFIDDPNGIILMEIGDGDDEPLGIAYPTYQPISCVYDYPPAKGSTLDYLVLILCEEEKVEIGLKPTDLAYRVIDDLNDYFVKREGQDVVILNDFTIPNFFLDVPAILMSDIVDSCNDSSKLSLIDSVLELADQFLVKGSVKVTSDFMHAFPKYWEYADDCVECKGTGQKGSAPCKTCRGTGKSIMTKVSDTKMLSYPQDKDTPVVTPNVAGYVEPSKIFYEIATADLQMLEDAMNFTIWGNTGRARTSGMNAAQDLGVKTATEIIDDLAPVVDRLIAISEMAEKRDKFIMDKVISINLKLYAYSGCSVNYGRRFIMESPDAVWLRYTDARTKGAPIATLNDLLRDFVETKYSDDPIMLPIMMKTIQLEPFVHLTVAQCEPLVESELDYVKKLYFSEWINSLLPNTLLAVDVITLSKMLDVYAADQYAKIQADRQAQADFQLQQQKAQSDYANIKTGNRIDALVN
jgi:hypothetical protein